MGDRKPSSNRTSKNYNIALLRSYERDAREVKNFERNKEILMPYIKGKYVRMEISLRM